jgi:hypothetical protein
MDPANVQTSILNAIQEILRFQPSLGYLRNATACFTSLHKKFIIRTITSVYTNKSGVCFKDEFQLIKYTINT